MTFEYDGMYSRRTRQGIINTESDEDLTVKDFEEAWEKNILSIKHSKLKYLYESSLFDIEVKLLPKKKRTAAHVHPLEPMGQLPLQTKELIHFYTSDYVVIIYSTKSRVCEFLEKEDAEDINMKHEYEVDIPEAGWKSEGSEHKSSSVTTPWASSKISKVEHDSLLLALLWRHNPDVIDKTNEKMRSDGHQASLFSLLPIINNDSVRILRTKPRIQEEAIDNRILVECLQLKLDLEVEPIFASMALYDVHLKKKISENFNFDMNPESLKKMLPNYDSNAADCSTMSRSGIFRISHPTSGLYLVIRLEKVLQGNIDKCIKPYVKHYKTSEKLREKTAHYCWRLGKYRMPFAWTAISVRDLIAGSKIIDISSRRNTLGTRTPSGDITDRNKHTSVFGARANTSWMTNLNSFLPVTVKLPCFIKQEMEYLSDNALLSLIRQMPLKRKHEVIPGCLHLRFSPCPIELKGCLSPEMVHINPVTGDHCAPIRELLEFPSRDDCEPYSSYRNLLYIYPRSFYPTGRQGPFRNITIKVELREIGQRSTVTTMYGKSSGPKLISTMYTVVSYHKKHPEFFDEIKINVPADFNKKYFLLFEFYHLNCSKKLDSAVETHFGFSWLPLFMNGNLRSGEFELPVTKEDPALIDFSECPALNNHAVKGLESHKGVFSVSLKPISSVHPEDQHVALFMNSCSVLKDICLPKDEEKLGANAELIFSLVQLPEAETRCLVKFLPTILNKIIWLIISSSKHYITQDQVGKRAFKTLVQIINKVALHGNCYYSSDKYRQNSHLVSYVHYQSHIPHPNHDFNLRMNNLKSMQETNENQRNGEHSRIKKAVENWESDNGNGQHKLLHHELLFHLNNSESNTKELALNNIWFFFDLIVKSMIEDLHWRDNLKSSKKIRATEEFQRTTSEFLEWILINIHQKPKSEEIGMHLIISTAHFLSDLLSVIDRGWVLILIKNFCYKIPADLQIFKLDFLYVICQHEQFIPLNFFGTLTSSRESSSARENVYSDVSKKLKNWSLFETYFELSSTFKKNHYLAGVLITCFQNSLSMESASLHEKAIKGLTNLLSSLDRDQRYQYPKEKKILASLFTPIVGITVRNLPRLKVTKPCISEEATRKSVEVERPPSGVLPEVNTINVSKSSFFFSVDCERYSRIGESISYLSAEETQSLLMCFLWVLKHVDKEMLKSSLYDLSPHKISHLLEVLVICLTCFEYKQANKAVPKKVYSTSLCNISNLESSFQRESEISKGPLSSSIGDTLCKQEIESPKKRDLTISRDGDLAAEVSLIVLDCLELFVEVLTGTLNEQTSMKMVIRALLEALGKTQSIAVLGCIFSTQRSLVDKFPALFFDDESELCKDLCLQLLLHCSSVVSGIRAQASLSIYLLMRRSFQMGHNFPWVKLQLTVAVSTLVATYKEIREDSIHKSLKNIIKYAEADDQYADTSLPDQVKELILSLHIILSDTIRIKEAQPDTEMLFDLMHRIANAHRSSPNLRLTWLINMAHKHIEAGSHAEAAMCMVHCAAIVAEYMSLTAEKPYFPKGAVAFEKISPNTLEESNHHEDGVNVEEGGLGKYFTEGGIVGLLEQAATSFYVAKLYEAMNEVYKIVIPIAESKRNYKKLANIHSKLHDAFSLIEKNQKKRVFGTFYRVAFYGEKFGELNECEFIYKEPNLTKLNEIFCRLQTFYEERFGASNLVVIKDSNTVNKKELDAEKLYIQITYVEPYFELHEFKSRVSEFERNFTIRNFMYATPFTPHGRPHGNIGEQWKRKTFLTTAHHFPYVKRRVPVIEKNEVVLTPIEVTIEDIENKTLELAATILQEPTDAKMLQMVLQGCIGTTVNQGPREVAVIFLSDLLTDNAKPTKFQNKLRLCLKEFANHCYDGLLKNEKLIIPEQINYQQELEKNFWKFIDYLEPLIHIKDSLKQEKWDYLRLGSSSEC